MSESEAKDPLRVTFEVAVGPNIDGERAMAAAAHAIPTDPANIANPEAPEAAAPTSTQE